MNADSQRRKQALARGVALGAAALLLAGCSLWPKPKPDPTQFYVLTATGSPAAPAARGPAIHLRTVELASYLKTRLMIVRRGDNQIEYRDFARWGEPLELGIARVVREELLARGAASVVRASPLRAVGVDYDATLVVRVLACEGGAGGEVFFRAAWELVTTGAPARVVARGDFQAADLRWDGKTEGELAQQLSRAVAGLGGDIAAGMAKARQ
jgi:uncharacterized lipoprotein YmbA